MTGVGSMVRVAVRVGIVVPGRWAGRMRLELPGTYSRLGTVNWSAT